MEFLTIRSGRTSTIGGMQRLSGLDASFLYLETATQPLHVCSILELDTTTMPGGYSFDRLKDDLALRIKAMPIFREKLADSPFNLLAMRLRPTHTPQNASPRLCRAKVSVMPGPTLLAITHQPPHPMPAPQTGTALHKEREPQGELLARLRNREKPS